VNVTPTARSTQPGIRWTRRSFCTQGPDPTQVVIWSSGQSTITEFQGVYILDGAPIVGATPEEVHTRLERHHDWQMDQLAQQDHGPWNDGIYGGM
jgi:hypothetical protein